MISTVLSWPLKKSLLNVSYQKISLSYCCPIEHSKCNFFFSFQQYSTTNMITYSNQSNGQVQTVGPGLERDVISSAFSVYITSFSKWFLPCFDDRASLQMSCGFWQAISGGVISEN